MLATDLGKCITSFVSRENESRSLLIDGKWGCGKTYEINRYLKDNPNCFFIYLSLFGVRDAEDVIVRLSEYLDSSYIKIINGHYSLKSLIEPKSINDCLIIFDDIERKNDSLSYSSLLAIVDSLKMLGFKVVCVVNSTQIEDKDYEEFREKAFDDIFNVQADYSAFSSISKSVSKSKFEKNLLKNVDDNWRIIQRAEIKYLSIIAEAKKRRIKDIFSLMNISESSYFRCCCLAEMCFFSRNNNKNESDDEDRNAEYEANVEEFGLSAANNLDYLFYEKKENNSLVFHVKALLYLLYDNDYDGYFANFNKKKSNITTVDPTLDKEVFLLDDKGKKNYRKTFLKRLNSFDFSQKYDSRILNNFLKYYSNSLSQSESKAIVDRITKTIPSDNYDSYLNPIVFTETKNPVMDSIKRDLRYRFEQKQDEANEESIADLGESKNYSGLTDFLYNSRNLGSEAKRNIAEVFLRSDFYLPDLSKEITFQAWSYCHEMAKFVSGTEFEKAYLKVLNKQIMLNPKSESLREKCKALIKYNFVTVKESDLIGVVKVPKLV